MQPDRQDSGAMRALGIKPAERIDHILREVQPTRCARGTKRSSMPRERERCPATGVRLLPLGTWYEPKNKGICVATNKLLSRRAFDDGGALVYRFRSQRRSPARSNS